MSDEAWLAAQFEAHRRHLNAVAYRMLGSVAEADEAVQDAWLRVSRAGAADVENLGGWLTTIVARVCLNLLQARKARREDDAAVPDPIVGPELGPEQGMLLADAVGLALQVVVDRLPPAERLAFVLHDIFDLPFEAIAPLVQRTPAATRQLASRGRRRVKLARARPDEVDLVAQRAVVDAFFAAARAQDFAALLAVLDDEAVLRSDGGRMRPELTTVLHGARAIAERAIAFAPRAAGHVEPRLVNGAAGAAVVDGEQTVSIMGFTIAGGKIVEIDTLADPERLRALGH